MKNIIKHLNGHSTFLFCGQPLISSSPFVINEKANKIYKERCEK